MTPVGARLRAPTGVIVFQVGVRGLSPRPPEASSCLLKDKVQLFLERIQIPRGPGAGFGVAGFEHVPDELGGSLSKALRRSRMGSRKAFMDSTRSFLQSSATSDSCVNVKKQRGRMPPAAKGAEPLWKPRLGKTMTPVGARLRAPTGVIVFQVGGPGAEPRPPEASSCLL